MLYNLQAFFCQHQKVFQAVLQEEGWPHLDSLLTRCVVKFYLQYHYYSHLWSANRELYQRLQRRHRKRQKSYRFRLAKQQIFTCISLHDFDVRLRNFMFCWGREHKTTTFFSFFLNFHTVLEFLFNSRKICQHLANWARWKKRDKVWSSENSLLLCCFHCRGRRCCLISLLFTLVTC